MVVLKGKDQFRGNVPIQIKVILSYDRYMCVMEEKSKSYTNNS